MTYNNFWNHRKINNFWSISFSIYKLSNIRNIIKISRYGKVMIEKGFFKMSFLVHWFKGLSYYLERDRDIWQKKSVRHIGIY